MKTDGKHDRLISRGFFILAVLGAASLLPPSAYSAENDDEYLISLPEKKPATTKPRITTQKKETPAQPAEPVKPVSRQSLLGGKNSEPDPSVEPAKNGRSGLMKGPGAGKKKTDEDEAEQPQRDPTLTKTVSRHSEGTTDYETITEYDGDSEIVTEVVTEHNRGMIVETTTVTEKKAGKVVRKTKNKTTRKEGAASASTDKQTKSILGRATDHSNTRNNGDVQAAQNAAATAKPASTANTAKTTTGKDVVSTTPAEAKEETPVVAVEEKKEPVEESVPAGEATKESEPVPTAAESEPAEKNVETDPGDDDKKEPDSEQKSGTVGNPFGVVRPSGGCKD